MISTFTETEHLSSYQQHVIDSLARLETNMNALIGNGQPGRMYLVEKAVERIDRKIWWFAGVSAAAGVFISVMLRVFLGRG